MAQYRSPEFTMAMNEYFDCTHDETRRVLLAVDEADQNQVLAALTHKLYDNIIAGISYYCMIEYIFKKKNQWNEVNLIFSPFTFLKLYNYSAH